MASPAPGHTDLSSPVTSSPVSPYDQPPNGEIPEWKCPCCNASLEHFKISADQSRPVASESQLPHVVGLFEQVATGQARPEKQMDHVIPGTKPKTPQLPAPPPSTYKANGGALETLDHPTIGGRVAICVLLYGGKDGEEHNALHRRCLHSIVSTVPPSRMDLRVACNQVGVTTQNYLKSLPVSKIYSDYKNRRKYPAMREMFWDEEDPIATKYIIWFDDDSYVLQPQWLETLAKVIIAQRPDERVGCYGSRMIHPLQSGGKSKEDPRQWFRNARWYRGKNFQDKRGNETANGQYIHFPVGGFWCLSTEAMRACDIPDTRLNHNGGDCCIGEQLHQGGYKIKLFNENKQYVKTSGAPRRGFHEKFLWFR